MDRELVTTKRAVSEESWSLRQAQATKEWQEIVESWATITPADQSSSTSSATGITDNNGNNTGEPLNKAKTWLKENSQGGKKGLDFAIGRLLEMEDRSDDVDPTTSSADDDMNNATRLRRIEYKVLLLLYLYQLKGSSSSLNFCKRFAKVLKQQSQSKKPKSKKGRRRHPNTSIAQLCPQDVFKEYLVKILSQAAFLLPVSAPFGKFLTHKILTKPLWNKQPLLVTYVLDSFEVENPYIPKPKEILLPSAPPRRKASKNKPAKSAKTVVHKKRRLPPKRQTFRGSHFHTKLKDITTMLGNFMDEDDGHATASSIRRTTTPRSAPSQTKKGSTKPSRITPPPAASVKRKPTQKPLKPATNRPAPKKPSSQSTKRPQNQVAETPLPNPKKRRGSTTATTTMQLHTPPRKKAGMVVAETPMPTTTTTTGIVAETPMTTIPTTAAAKTTSTTLAAANNRFLFSPKPFSNHHKSSNHTAVTTPFLGATPIGKSTTMPLLGATPNGDGERLLFSPPSEDDTPRVQPMSLFGTIKPKVSALTSSTIFTKSKLALKPKIRTAQTAVAAARAYLQRKSM